MSEDKTIGCFFAAMILLVFGLFGFMFVRLTYDSYREPDTYFILKSTEYVTAGGIGGRVATVFHSEDGRTFTFDRAMDAPAPGRRAVVWYGQYEKRLEWK